MFIKICISRYLHDLKFPWRSASGTLYIFHELCKPQGKSPGSYSESPMMYPSFAGRIRNPEFIHAWNSKQPAFLMVVSVGWFPNIPNLYLGNGWKSPFPSIKNWLFGVPGGSSYSNQRLCLVGWTRQGGSRVKMLSPSPIFRRRMINSWWWRFDPLTRWDSYGFLFFFHWDRGGEILFLGRWRFHPCRWRGWSTDDQPAGSWAGEAGREELRGIVAVSFFLQNFVDDIAWLCYVLFSCLKRFYDVSSWLPCCFW